MTRLHLEGKVAIVTGAASGIGLACVRRFACEGARVVGIDLNEPIEDLDLPHGAEEVGFGQVDVRDEAAVASFVRTVVDEYGRVDAVVTAAGVAGGGPVHMVDQREWQRVLDINLTGTFLMCKHVIAQMVQQDPMGSPGTELEFAL